MTLPTGTISMSQVNTELGNPTTTNISLNDADVRALASIPSGTISMNDLRGQSAFSMTGGTEISSPDGYTYRFYTSSTPISYSGSATVEFVVIAGGGNCAAKSVAGGGGAGGLRLGSVTLPAPIPSAPLTITVGGGGSNSSAFGIESAAGGDVLPSSDGRFGGSGAGGSFPGGTGGLGNVPSVTPPQGRDGGDNLSTPTVVRGGGGGGGRGGVGNDPPSSSPPGTSLGGGGGNGIFIPGWDIPPSYGQAGPPFVPGQYFSGGGGGGSYERVGGTGGRGGGGIGGTFGPAFPSSTATPGDANTGGGGGGPGESSDPPTNGGSGIVIVRY